MLEVGCSKGYLLEEASNHFDVEGIDISEYAISAASSAIRSKVAVADLEEVDLAQETYDVVVAFNILEHLRHPEAAVAKVRRSLKQGGFLIGSVPNNTRPLTRLFTWVTNLIDRTHRSTFSAEGWRHVFLKAGYRRIEFFGEIPAGMNHCWYLKGSIWRHCALNLMFVCWK